MGKWTDVIEAQRRWADRISRTDGRFQYRAPSPPSPLLRAYYRILSILGKALVTLGILLQDRYQHGSGNDDGRVPIGR